MRMTYEEALRASQQQNWQRLSPLSRVEMLQAIENHVAAEMHRTPREVEGKWLYVDGNGVLLGQYVDKDKKIQVNFDHLGPDSQFGETSDRMIETVLHEGRHSYQKQVVAGEIAHPNAEETKAWAANLAPGGYVSFNQNPRAYYGQPVEVDARSFAEGRLRELQQERAAMTQTKDARETFVRQVNQQTQAAHPREASPRESNIQDIYLRDSAKHSHGMKR